MDELDINIAGRVESALDSATGRMVARRTRIAPKRPAPPRNVKLTVISGTYWKVTWEPPAKGTVFDGFRIRKDRDSGTADFEVSHGQTSQAFFDGTRFFVSTYISNGVESLPVVAQ